METEKLFGFELRTIHNLIREIVRNSGPTTDRPPLTQLQAGIVCYLFHHQGEPVYQKHIEEEFNISGATATNTLRVMERNGLIIRSSIDRDARLKRITITQPAMQDQIRVEEHIKRMEQKILKGISGEEKAELFRMLGIVRSNMEELKREIDCSGSSNSYRAEGRHSKRV